MASPNDSTQTWMLSFGDLLTLLLCFFLLLISTGAMKPKTKESLSAQNHSIETNTKVLSSNTDEVGNKVANKTIGITDDAFFLTSSDLVSEGLVQKLGKLKEESSVEIVVCAPSELGGWSTANEFAEILIKNISSSINVRSLNIVGSNCLMVNRGKNTEAVVGIKEL